MKNFQTGGNLIKTVYGSVVRRYTFSAVDAHKADRVKHWMGANVWTHKTIKQFELDQDGKPTGKQKELKVFPGHMVNPRGTSQTCWKCQRNPHESISNDEKYTINNSLLKLENGSIKLFSGKEYSKNEFKLALKRKENLPLNKVISDGNYNGREIKRWLKQSMRQKNKSQLSKDTTQSRYHCVYIDCLATYHADEGAAINIGRKFLKQKLHGN